MSANTKSPPAPQDTANAQKPDGVLSLQNALQGCTNAAEKYRRSVRTLATHFDSPYAIIQIDAAATNFTQQASAGSRSTEAWKRHCEGMLLSTKYSGTARARLFYATGVDQTFAVLSVPVPGEGKSAAGSLALVTECRTAQLAEARLSELASLVRAAHVLSNGREPSGSTQSPETKTARSSTVARLNGYESLHEFAFSLVNDLKGKIGADQVALGFVRKDQPRLLCMSGFDNLYPRSPGTRLVQQAMAECYDAEKVVCYQQDKEWNDDGANTGHHLHRAWHEASGNVPVASIPLVDGQTCRAVLSIRRPAGKPFHASELEKIRNVVSPYAPGLVLLERANRSAARHLYESLISLAASFVAPGAVGRKVTMCVAIAVAAWTILGRTDHVIDTPCEVAPARSIHVAAPFEGAIAESLVRPGDQVHSGQLLLRMDTEVLDLELGQASADMEMASLERAQAAAVGDLAQTALADARIEIAKSHMANLRQKIARAEIRAPQDGSVLTGDLRQRIGEVVLLGEPLLEFAESGNWIVKLHVPEFSAAYLQTGMTGDFVTNGRPDEPGAFEVQQMDLTASVVDGRNVLVAEGWIQGETSTWFRSGMLGVARIDAGKKPVWWVWSHRLLDAVRLQAWKW